MKKIDPAVIGQVVKNGDHMVQVRVFRLFGHDFVVLHETKEPRMTDKKTGMLPLNPWVANPHPHKREDV